MICEKCGKNLEAKQKRWCSPRCSKLGLKSLYKKRNKEKVNAYAREYRFNCNQRPLTTKKKLKCIDYLGNQCEKCLSKDKLEIHHIRPLKTIGTNNMSNLMCLCKPCHQEWEKRMKGFWY